MSVRIAFIGLEGSGKNEAARTLELIGFQALALADPIKRMLLALGIPNQCLYGTHAEKRDPVFNGMSGRQLMRSLGDDWGRRLDVDFWVKQLVRMVENSSPSIDFVVTDLRRPNEADALRGLGFRIVRIVYPGLEPGDHASETDQALVGVDGEILNDAGISELRQEVCSLVHRIRAAQR